MYSRHTRNTLTSKRMRRKKKNERRCCFKMCVDIPMCVLNSVGPSIRLFSKWQTTQIHKDFHRSQKEKGKKTTNRTSTLQLSDDDKFGCMRMYSSFHIGMLFEFSALFWKFRMSLSLSLLTIRNVLSFIQTVVEFTVVQLCAWVCIGVDWERTDREIERIFDVREHFFEHRIWHLRWSLVCVCVCVKYESQSKPLFDSNRTHALPWNVTCMRYAVNMSGE